nr:hypothetical protein BV199_00869 [Haemophilus influenzae]PRK32307.1 hypothetical protein BV198_01114 [Haemophilus influenzae]
MFSSDLIVPPEVVVKMPCSAFTVTLSLAVTLDTVKASPVAVSVTEPEVDSIPPLILPVLAVTSTLPVVALMVVPALVVTFPVVAEIFIVLWEVTLLFTVTSFAEMVKPVLLSLPASLPPLDVPTSLCSVTL